MTIQTINAIVHSFNHRFYAHLLHHLTSSWGGQSKLILNSVRHPCKTAGQRHHKELLRQVIRHSPRSHTKHTHASAPRRPKGFSMLQSATTTGTYALDALPFGASDSTTLGSLTTAVGRSSAISEAWKFEGECQFNNSSKQPFQSTLRKPFCSYY